MLKIFVVYSLMIFALFELLPLKAEPVDALLPLKMEPIDALLLLDKETKSKHPTNKKRPITSRHRLYLKDSSTSLIPKQLVVAISVLFFVFSLAWLLDKAVRKEEDRINAKRILTNRELSKKKLELGIKRQKEKARLQEVRETATIKRERAVKNTVKKRVRRQAIEKQQKDIQKKHQENLEKLVHNIADAFFSSSIFLTISQNYKNLNLSPNRNAVLSLLNKQIKTYKNSPELAVEALVNRQGCSILKSFV